MRQIGRSVSEAEIDNRDNWEQGTIVDFRGRRFIKTDELYTPEGPTTLDWENLGEIRRLEESRFAVIPKIGDFGDLLFHLIKPLEKKGEFSLGMEKDFLCFLRCNYGSGIEVYTGRGSDPHGRTGVEIEYYYPKRIEDAQGYLRDTLKTSGIPARIGEWVYPNREE